MHIKIKKLDLLVYALFIAVFKTYAVPQVIQQGIKIVLLAFVGIVLVRKLSKKNINIVIISGISIMLSSIIGYVNGVVGFQSVYNGLLHFICLYEIFMVAKFFKENSTYNSLLGALYRITTMYCALSLLSIFIQGTSTSGTEITYVFGSKFMTSYYFIMWLCLFENIYRSNIRSVAKFKAFYTTLILAVILICYHIHCATAVVGTVFLVVYQVLPDKIRQVMSKPLVVLLAVAAAGVFPYYVSTLLNNNRVSFIITEIFGKSMNLTGRMIIYRKLIDIINLRPWIGYGYGNEAVSMAVTFGNAQNGLMQHLVNYGYIGLIVLIITVYYCLRKHEYSRDISGWYSMIYVMIVCSTVEISYNYLFYLSLFIVGCFKTTFPSHSQKPNIR